MAQFVGAPRVLDETSCRFAVNEVPQIITSYPLLAARRIGSSITGSQTVAGFAQFHSGLVSIHMATRPRICLTQLTAFVFYS
jgi:hypothetical protein